MGLRIKVLCECKRSSKSHFLVISNLKLFPHICSFAGEEDSFARDKKEHLMKIHALQDYGDVLGDGGGICHNDISLSQNYSACPSSSFSPTSCFHLSIHLSFLQVCDATVNP